ncbi:hypothetical protein Bbelb_401530 [Branchiostoma belcheri]|nr:hypothetical protein Bbelb_445920 [Branchiostoma belcheri]KAI8482066.1 hypothetical protein Bbelb_401530 [Branchiostoma belcheri]
MILQDLAVGELEAASPYGGGPRGLWSRDYEPAARENRGFQMTGRRVTHRVSRRLARVVINEAKQTASAVVISAACADKVPGTQSAGARNPIYICVEDVAGFLRGSSAPPRVFTNCGRCLVIDVRVPVPLDKCVKHNTGGAGRTYRTYGARLVGWGSVAGEGWLSGLQPTYFFLPTNATRTFNENFQPIHVTDLVAHISVKTSGELSERTQWRGNKTISHNVNKKRWDAFALPDASFQN